MKTRFPHGFVLTVMSDDHPGIVAAVSDAVESLGGNIDSCSQTVLGGYFTLIMIVSVPEPIDPERLAESVRGAESSGSGFQVLVRSALRGGKGPPRRRPTASSSVLSARTSRASSGGSASTWPARTSTSSISTATATARIRAHRSGRSAQPLGHPDDAGRLGADGPGTRLHGQAPAREHFCGHEPVAADPG